LRNLAEQLAAWLRADLAILESAEPAMPVEDRAADTWEPLITVADHAGGHWPDRGRAAVLALTAQADESNEGSIRIRLLADCRTAFTGHTALPTSRLLTRLNNDQEAPWRDFGHGGLTAAKLGRLLGEYDIRSSNIRFPDGSQSKGYQRADFADAWTRYCATPIAAVGPGPEGNASQPSQPSHRRSERDGSLNRDGSTRPDISETGDDDPALWDGPNRSNETSRTGLTSKATPGTSGTPTPLRRVGGAA
jgi:Protein of unknown function (DUF3631)